MKTYIEVVEIETNKPIHRIDVTGRGERNIDRTEEGININLNHAKYLTQIIESVKELPTGDLKATT